MTEIKFFHPVEVRYGDLDPQGHLNNAKYLTYFEQARVAYLINLELFEKTLSFLEIGMIIADIHIVFYKPVLWETPVKVGAAITKIGNKSFIFSQNIIHAETGEVFADGEVIMVAFDYHNQETISLPAEWRKKIARFES
ncbi:MAG TPA: acyl-CoA thioesterase [Anaerolineales bacterium]|nr:acyl-CoA thioesterase [Anaerolineales bacterium]